MELFRQEYWSWLPFPSPGALPDTEMERSSPALQADSLPVSQPANVGDIGLLSGSGRAPGEGNGNPLQYFCLNNSMDRGAWQLKYKGSQRVRPPSD